jgi:hypothetical protein
MRINLSPLTRLFQELHTSVRPPIGGDIPQVHHMFGMESLGERRKSVGSYLAQGEQ